MSESSTEQVVARQKHHLAKWMRFVLLLNGSLVGVRFWRVVENWFSLQTVWHYKENTGTWKGLFFEILRQAQEGNHIDGIIANRRAESSIDELRRTEFVLNTLGRNLARKDLRITSNRMAEFRPVLQCLSNRTAALHIDISLIWDLLEEYSTVGADYSIQISAILCTLKSIKVEPLPEQPTLNELKVYHTAMVNNIKIRGWRRYIPFRFRHTNLEPLANPEARAFYFDVLAYEAIASEGLFIEGE